MEGVEEPQMSDTAVSVVRVRVPQRIHLSGFGQPYDLSFSSTIRFAFGVLMTYLDGHCLVKLSGEIRD